MKISDAIVILNIQNNYSNSGEHTAYTHQNHSHAVSASRRKYLRHSGQEN